MNNTNVSESAINALKTFRSAVNDAGQACESAVSALKQSFEANAGGLGAHSQEIGNLLEELELLSKEGRSSTTRLCLKLDKAIRLRSQHRSNNPYERTGSGEKAYGRDGQYVKTQFGGTVSISKTGTGEAQRVDVSRTVWKNNKIDPNLKIPAGTRRSNGTVISVETTNLVLMQKGQAPFIENKDDEGRIFLDQIELHHLTGNETMRFGNGSGGTADNGTLVEIPASVHDKWNRVLHEGQPSFRKGVRIKRKVDGSIRRIAPKSFDSKKFEAFRRIYWKKRAQELLDAL